jgi:hypothetical protein
MQKIYLSQFLRNALCILAAFMFMGGLPNAKGQTTATVGTGTSTTSQLPIYSCYGYTYSQQLYTASEISAAGGSTGAGVITKIRFYFSSGAATNSDGWNVYIGNTTKTTFSGTTDWVPTSGMSLRFSGTVTYPASGNWLEIPLSTPFTWDGTSSIVIGIDENTPSWYCSSYWRYTTATNTCIYYYSDGTNPDPASPPTASSLMSVRPNIQFVFENICSGTPTAGTSLASSTSLCSGATTTLSLPTATSGVGISYQWEQSSTGTGGWTNVVGATTATFIASPTATTYYRCLVSCTTSGLSAYSTVVLVSFVNNISTATGATRCGTGTVSLTAAGSTGTTLKWYTAATGGSSIGTGSPFTSPTISTTTNYYVGAETSASGIGQIGTGTALTSSYSYPTAYGNYWYQDWQQIVYTAAELNATGLAAGNITALAFNISGLPGPSSVSGYSIKIGTTSSSTLTTFTTSGLTNVYGPTSVTPSSGWNTITFSTPFNWDGTSNIIVDIRGDGAYGSANATTYYTTTSGNTCLYAYSYSSSSTFYTSSPTANTSTSRPNIRFTGNQVCSSPRSLVTATVNTAPAFSITGTQTVCNNATATLNVSSSLPSYNTYTWSPITGLFTDASCTVPYTTGTSASTVYSKTTSAGSIKYFCTANNTTSLCSALDSVIVTTLPASVTAVATPANICFSGNTKLTLSPSSGYGAGQFQWQSSANNSTWSDSTGMTSSSLTTATVSNTRYYRVVLKNSAGTFCLNGTSDTALVLKPSVTTVTDGVRCAPGTVTIGATATDGNIDWFAASSGGSVLGSGNSYTTPSISSTTTYYAEARATPDASFVIGTGTVSLSGTGLSPFSQYYESTRTQYLVTVSDLLASGMTSGQFATMAFNISTKYSSKDYKGYTVKFANTTATSLSGFASATFTTVFGPSLYTPASGANVFPLTGGFSWDGTSNLLVEICFSNATGSYDGWSSDDVVSATTKSYTCTYGTYADNAYFCSGGTGSLVSSTNLPNMTFTRKGCVSSRSPVVATVNPLPTPTISPATGPIQICDGNTTTLTGAGGGTYQWKDASGLISGATSSTYTTGATGTYRVVVTNPTTGCKDSTAFVGVNVNPVPTVSIAPAGTTQICEDSSQKFTSTVTGSGLTYQWFKGSTMITGATKDSLRVNSSGIYTLRVYLGTCSDTSNDGNLIVNPLPAASFTKTGTTGAICLGSTFELTALTVPATSSYQWSLNGVDIPGATSKIFNASLGGIYTVRIRDANNCRRTSDTASLINTPMGIPNLSPKEARFCEGTILKLYSNAGPYASKFAWTRNGVPLPDTTAQILSAINGTYDVTVTDIYGCVLLSPKTTLSVDPLPIKPIVTKTGMVLSTTTPYYTYQWFRNGKAITGATLRNYTMMFDGKYHVEVTNSYNCMNESDTLSIQGLSVKKIAREDINIDVYPNPSQNIINISAPIEVNVIVQDVQGKKILDSKNTTQVDMGAYADGVYIFTITDKEGLVLKMDKVVKRTN